jgi:hypothetical protein
MVGQQPLQRRHIARADEGDGVLEEFVEGHEGGVLGSGALLFARLFERLVSFPESNFRARYSGFAEMGRRTARNTVQSLLAAAGLQRTR